MENHETPYGGQYVTQGKRLGAPKDQHIDFIVAILQHFLESVMGAFGKKPIIHFAEIDIKYYIRRKVKCMSEEVLDLDESN